MIYRIEIKKHPQSRWKGCARDYDVATLMEQFRLPVPDYNNFCEHNTRSYFTEQGWKEVGTPILRYLKGQPVKTINGRWVNQGDNFRIIKIISKKEEDVHPDKIVYEDRLQIIVKIRNL